MVDGNMVVAGVVVALLGANAIWTYVRSRMFRDEPKDSKKPKKFKRPSSYVQEAENVKPPEVAPEHPMLPHAIRRTHVKPRDEE